MLEEIKRYFQNGKWKQVQDLRVLGLTIFLIIVLLVTWSGVKTIQTNYSLQRQISALQQQVTVQQLLNNNQALKNTYFQTDQYLELAARENFGVAAPGEKELIVPQSVALAHLTKTSQTAQTVTASNPEPQWQRNFQSWIDFFLNRQSYTN